MSFAPCASRSSTALELADALTEDGGDRTSCRDVRGRPNRRMAKASFFVPNAGTRPAPTRPDARDRPWPAGSLWEDEADFAGWLSDAGGTLVCPDDEADHPCWRLLTRAGASAHTSRECLLFDCTTAVNTFLSALERAGALMAIALHGPVEESRAICEWAAGLRERTGAIETVALRGGGRYPPAPQDWRARIAQAPLPLFSFKFATDGVRPLLAAFLVARERDRMTIVIPHASHAGGNKRL